MNRLIFSLVAVLMIVAVGCIGEKSPEDVAGGNQPSVAVQQNQQNVPGVGAIAPDTQTNPQTQPKTETQTDKGIAVKTGEIVKTGKVLTPSEETAKKFLIAVSAENYGEAVKYMDAAYLKKLQGFFGGQTDQEVLYIAVKRAPEYYGPGVSEIKILSERRDFVEKWSAKDNKPVKYDTAGVVFEVFSTKKTKGFCRVSI